MELSANEERIEQIQKAECVDANAMEEGLGEANYQN